MKRVRMSTLTGMFAVICMLTLNVAVAQQVTGTPGSPSATKTIDGKQLPPMPDEKFGGKIERKSLKPENLEVLVFRIDNQGEIQITIAVQIHNNNIK